MRFFISLFAATTCIVACQEDPAEMAGRKAREVWRQNESVVERVMDGEAALDEEFMGAWRFFRDTIGIVIRLDGDYAGLTLTNDSKEDFDLIRNWYRSNSGRLYWDEAANTVRVQAPPGPAGDIWWSHESVLLDLIAGEAVSELRQAETRRFFLNLTGIDVFAANDRRIGLVPPKGPQTLLPGLRKWYEENEDRLSVDASSGSLKIRP